MNLRECFVAREPVCDLEQRLAARLIIASDRGCFVRDAAGYRDRLALAFSFAGPRGPNGGLRQGGISTEPAWGVVV